MSGRRTSGWVGNLVILLGLGGSGHPVRSDVRWFLELQTSGKWRPSGVSGSTRDLRSWARFWTEFGDFGLKIDKISWMKDGETWGNARSTRNQANPWIKINKTSSNQQITQKKLGLFLVGIFGFREEHNKIKLEKEGQGLQIRDQRGS